MLISRLLILCFLIAAAANSLPADEPSLQPAEVAFFETKIRPVLVQHCFECHSATAKEIGGKLLLDSREGILKGGESGAAISAGNPDESLLLSALKHDGLEMPPAGKLPDAVINDFAQWIARGAADPRGDNPPESLPVSDEAQRHWSFIPPLRPDVPVVSDTSWARTEIDRFVLARIEAAGLRPAGDATPQALVRRLYIDLIGLPPTMEQSAEFAAAFAVDAQAAIETLADTLLASPQFGERWGRHWLDVARYGESNGNDGLGRNPTFPHAWRYRDYVIAAMNSDMPYDRFLTEQIAGDLLPAESPEVRDRQLVATGFLAVTAKPAKAMNTNFEMDIVADQIDVVSTGVMGLSVACARCHDHKFDPISTRDYYSLAGLFSSTETLWGLAAGEGLTAPATDLHVLKAAANVLPPKDFVETVLVLDSNTGVPRSLPKPPWPAGRPLAMGVRDREKLNDCRINIKGDSQKLGDPVPRGFLTQCSSQPSSIAVNSAQSGRLELAQWLTEKTHPLTARVLVNRIWHHLFGAGIVRTPDDFGRYGERPTHPELLDYMAVRLMEDNWSIKRLIRSIVVSRAYRLSSDPSHELLAADVENTLLTHHRRRRLDAESLRDAMLQVSGGLNLQPPEGSIIRHRDILVNLAGNLHQPSSHRSVYLCYLRSSPPPELAVFDLPEFTTVVGKRDVSTVPGQALHLFNSPFVVERAREFAQLVMQQSSSESRILSAWRLAFGRIPDAEEMAQAMRFVSTATPDAEAQQIIWAAFCQGLLMSNEFRYVD